MDINGKNLPPEKRNLLLFMMLVQQYERIAKMNLGEIPNPAHNQVEMDLKAARFAIDTLEMLKSFCKESLTVEAAEYLESSWQNVSNILKEKENADS